MTKDMEAAALKAGPKTHARWRAANKYYETKLNRDIPIIEEIIKKKYPEEVMDIVLRSSAKGASRLSLLKKQMPQKQWDATVATTLSNLGLETPGGGSTAQRLFSPTTFMTNYRKLAPSAKKVLFSGGKHAELGKELDDFVRVAGDAKAIEEIANKSKTGSVLMFFSLFQTIGGTAGAVAGGAPGFVAGSLTAGSMIGLPRLTAKLMVNPRIVRWLSQGIKIAKNNPNSMPVHLGRLMFLANKEEVKDDVNNLIRYFLEE
jgi:hypothetical protein